ncbi:MAG: class I tRNA ligase family protein, partial [Patescibacteria group bacterium]
SHLTAYSIKEFSLVQGKEIWRLTSVKDAPEMCKVSDLEAQKVAAEMSANIDTFRLDLAADQVYHFVWDRFAAEMLEQSKDVLKGTDVAAKNSRCAALHEILLISLKLLHPFMPFVTEAIWQQLPKRDSDLLMVAKWPTDVKV